MNETDDDYTPEKVTRRANLLAKTYSLELGNFHRASPRPNGMPYSLGVGGIVTVYDDNHPRGMWRLGRVKALIPSSDGIVLGVTVKVTSKSGHTSVIRRPMQQIYPLETKSKSIPMDNSDMVLSDDQQVTSAYTTHTRPLSKR